MIVEDFVIDDVVDLNSLKSTGSIKCPYCKKGRSVIYSATGMVSNPCGNCHRMVLWDYDNNTAYKASVRTFTR